MGLALPILAPYRSWRGGVSTDNLNITNSRGLIWVDPNDGTVGNFRNAEQAGSAYGGKPAFDSKHLPTVIGGVTPSVLVGAVGVCLGCFDEEVIGAMMKANCEHDDGACSCGYCRHILRRL